MPFLNSSESRPCGGFLGSFGIVDFDQGSLQELEIFDVYTVDWQLWEEVEAPAALKPFMEDGKILARLEEWIADTGYSTVNRELEEAAKLVEEKDKD